MLLTLWMQSTTDQELCLGEKEAQLSLAILELALFWLQKPRLIEKLFKVFVPRYRLYRRAYTSLHRLPRTHYPSAHAFHAEGFAVLELRGNPWPAVRAANRGRDSEPYRHNYLINILVAAAQKSVLPAGSQSSTSSP
ncbi:putative mitochondrial ribosomal protein L17 [Paragonimus heterotremus]|uniref:Putative mitochondrial ribosomal protein L17 n=1 Tax=Paragonimus heterotremus TaxID=100268 RepID=A0A8J4TLE0_9TREM|nr:putative mitochondrial ribosomal protein L17 [Paragonimus heterotremus]